MEARFGRGALLKKPAKLERLVRGIADGVPIPLTVKIRLGAGSSEAPATTLAEAVENAGAAGGRHPRAHEGAAMHARRSGKPSGTSRAPRIPVIGNGDILTWYGTGTAPSSPARTQRWSVAGRS